MGTPSLRILSISDIHLGHARVPTEFIIQNLDTYFLQNSIFENLDICFLAGDVFDRLQQLSDNNVVLIQRWMVRLLKLCKRFDVQLRVLEGTPSHDRNQSVQFVLLNQVCKIDADLKYIDTVTIEHNEKHNIDVLYVPDRYHATTAETLDVFDTLMKDRGITQVDYAVMHGNFPHQLPQGLGIPAHDPEAYLERVRKYIFIGHVHQKSVYERILSQGSFDRLLHGEEEDKGYWLVESHRDGVENDKLTFVINKDAKVFKSINFVATTEEDPIAVLLHRVENLPYDSHLQLVIEKSDPRIPEIEAIIKSNPQHHWKFKWFKVDDDVAITDITPQQFQSTDINPETITSLVKTEFTKTTPWNAEVNTIFQTFLSHQHKESMKCRSVT